MRLPYKTPKSAERSAATNPLHLFVMNNYETVLKKGQEWQKCSFEWGIEDYVTVITESGERLILVDIEEYHNDEEGGVRYTPVITHRLRQYKGDS